MPDLESKPESESDEEREFLERSLDDLDREHAAGDLDDADYRRLRRHYEARAAGAVPPRRPRRLGRSIAVGVSVAALAVAAGLFVADLSGQRLDGEALSGSIREGVSGDLARAASLVRAGKALDAIKLYDKILADDPAQPEALANRGWLLRLAGRQAADPSLVDRGEGFIDRALVADPGFAQAHFFKGMILFEDRNRAADAVGEFEAFLRLAPDDPLKAVVEGVLARAREQSSGS